MAMTKRYDHANEERYGAAIEALDEAGKTGSQRHWQRRGGGRLSWILNRQGATTVASGGMWGVGVAGGGLSWTGWLAADTIRSIPLN
jgi:hypothetical protein